MAEITVIPAEDKQAWEKFLSQHPEANFLQSWYWGEFHQSLGKTIHRTGFYRDQALVGEMLSIVDDAKRGRYLTVPGGPIINWDDPDLVHKFVEVIKEIAGEERCAFNRVRPQLTLSDYSKNLFAGLGFVKAPIHLHAE